MPKTKIKLEPDSGTPASKLTPDSRAESAQNDATRRSAQDSFRKEVERIKTQVMGNDPQAAMRSHIESVRESLSDEPAVFEAVLENGWLDIAWYKIFADDVLDKQRNEDEEHERKVLWTASILLLSVDPLELLDTTPNLQVSKEDVREIPFDNGQHPNPFWSAEFGRILARIITHPLWNGPRPQEKITFMLKWAVICRTDDRRPMRCTNPTTCWVIDALVGTVNTATGPISELHSSIRRMAISLGRTPSVESNLLEAISSRIPTPASPKKSGPNQPYTLCLEDLRIVTAALDSCEGLVDNSEMSVHAFLAAFEYWDKNVDSLSYQDLYFESVLAHLYRKVLRNCAFEN